MERKQVVLEQFHVQIALALGNGNLSLGIRIALEQADKEQYGGLEKKVSLDIVGIEGSKISTEEIKEVEENTVLEKKGFRQVNKVLEEMNEGIKTIKERRKEAALKEAEEIVEDIREKGTITSSQDIRLRELARQFEEVSDFLQKEWS